MKLLLNRWWLIALMVSTANAFSENTLVQLSNERKLFMHCEGKGSPTVILISGYPDRGDASWETPQPEKKGATIFSEISQFTKVCDYDRPGTIKIVDDQLLKSRSDPVQQPVTAKNQVNDLYDLLKTAKINKPFIIVAHSAGGLIARLYALTYPNDVSGLILIDVTNEKLLQTWTPKEIEVFQFSSKLSAKELSAHYKDVEVINFAESFKQLEHYEDQKLHIPAILLTPDQVPDASQLIKNGTWPPYVTQNMAESIIKGISRANDLVADSFIPKAKHIKVKNSGHYIQKDQPALVLELIRTMVKQQQ